jgi:hypothetical protein
MLLASAGATLFVAVVAAAAAFGATDDGFVLVVTAVCGIVLGIDWLCNASSFAASQDMARWLQVGLLITCPVVPILVAVATAAGFGGAMILLTVFAIVGLVVDLRKIDEEIADERAAMQATLVADDQRDHPA